VQLRARHDVLMQVAEISADDIVAALDLDGDATHAERTENEETT